MTDAQLRPETWNPVTWCQPGATVALHPDQLKVALCWRKPRRVTVTPHLFDPAVPSEFIAQVFAVMIAVPEDTFLVATGHSERMTSLLCDIEFGALISSEFSRLLNSRRPLAPLGVQEWIWIGVTVEDQRQADARLSQLSNVRAAVRYASCQPLLGPLDLSPWLGSAVNWVVASGEAGRKARPTDPAWLRALRDQCGSADVPFRFTGRLLDGEPCDEFPQLQVITASQERRSS